MADGKSRRTHNVYSTSALTRGQSPVPEIAHGAIADAYPSATDLTPFVDLRSEDHRKIYTQISKANQRHPMEREHPCTLYHIIAYAIRSIIFPNINSSQILDLLDLLAQLEIIRREALTVVNDALWVNRELQKQPDEETIYLSDYEMSILRRLRKLHRSVRTTYFKLILGYCQLHIYELWVSQKTDSIRPHMVAYFPRMERSHSNRFTATAPSITSNCTIPQPLFHALDINDDEQAALAKTTESCRSFIGTAMKWQVEQAEEHDLSGDEDELFRQPEFVAVFRQEVPCSVSEDTLAQLAESYLGHVEQLMRGLEEILER